MQVSNLKLDISKFHFSEKMDLATFFEDLEKIPVGDKDFDRKVLLLKVRHRLIDQLSFEEMEKLTVRDWKSLN